MSFRLALLLSGLAAGALSGSGTMAKEQVIVPCGRKLNAGKLNHRVSAVWGAAVRAAQSSSAAWGDSVLFLGEFER